MVRKKSKVVIKSNPFDSENLAKTFFSSIRNSKKIFAIAPQAENFTSTPQIQKEFLINLNLDSTTQYLGRDYTFNFPNSDGAHNFWDNLSSEVEPLQREALKRLNLEKTLTVQTIPSEMCALPVICFNPLRDNAQAYVFMTHFVLDTSKNFSEARHLNLAIMDRRFSLTQWETNVYRPIYRKKVPVVDIPYD
ncbi:MAG: hypothetical protein KKC19_02840 [Nanoarchaeota archaeon]|nr:hypothetical protein [Nanoarchaeota archaeon]